MADLSPVYSIHVSTARTWRGGENQIWLLARELKARGQPVMVVAPRGAPLLERCAGSGISAQAIKVRGALDLLGAWRLLKLLRKENPHILHLHDGHAVTAGQLVGRAFPRERLRVIAHRRTVFDVNAPRNYRGRVDRVIAISHAVREKLREAGIAGESIRVVYSGMEFPECAAEAAEELRKQLGIPDGAVLIAHAAALTREKRQADMLEALALANKALKAKSLPSVHLALAGAGDRKETLIRAARQHGLDSSVHFLGFVRDLSALWKASALAVYASEAEGLCTALIEAQGAGLPAIITRAGGMTEVVEDGKTGIVVEVGGTAALADAIVKLAGDAPLRREMGLAAAQRARTMFSAEAMVDGVLGVYRELFSAPLHY